MNRFDVGQKALMQRLSVTAGRQITYSYGTLSGQPPVYTPVGEAVFSLTNSLGMWVGRTMFSRMAKGPGAATVEWGDRDYLCSVWDFFNLVGDGGSALPVRGDRITDTDEDGVTMVFELQTPTGEPVWRYSDQTLQTFRLHCKRVQ